MMQPTFSFLIVTIPQRAEMLEKVKFAINHLDGLGGVPLEILTACDEKMEGKKYYYLHNLIPQAKYNYIITMDDDMILCQDWLVRIVPWIDRYDVVGTKMYELDGANTTCYPRSLIHFSQLGYAHNADHGLAGCAVLISSWLAKNFLPDPEAKHDVKYDSTWTLKMQAAGYSLGIAEDAIAIRIAGHAYPEQPPGNTHPIMDHVPTIKPI